MKSSNMADAVEPSLSRHLFNLARQYEDVVDLTLGDPDLKPAECIREAACSAIAAGKTRYSANAGIIELREAVASCIKQDYGIVADSQSQLIVTVGGMEALFLALASTIDAGDEVVIFAPYYVNYVQMVRMCGGVPSFVWTRPEDSFSWTEEQLREVVTDRTTTIIVNTPCNPTGRVFSSEELDVVAKVANEFDLLVITDEVYKTLVFDGRQHDSMLYRDGMSNRTVLVDSVSKRFAMTGYRLGFAFGPREIVANMTKMQENVAACAPLPSQYAALEAYTSCLGDTWIRDEFESRRNYVCDALQKLPGISFLLPDATFYLWLNISGTHMSCTDFAYRLLEQQQVAVVPGITYGERYQDYVRIAFTHQIPVLEEGVRRIAAFLVSVKEGELA